MSETLDTCAVLVRTNKQEIIIKSEEVYTRMFSDFIRILSISLGQADVQCRRA